MSFTRRFVAGAFAGALALGLAACGDDDDNTTASEASSPAAEAKAVNVTTVDYRYEGLPSEVASGTTLTMRNRSDREVHEMIAIRLPDSDKRSVKDLLALPQAELEGLFTGEPAMVMVAEPGKDAFPAVGDGTLKEAGRYLVFCAIPTGADPAAYMAAAQTATDGPPQVAGGPPHFTQGMAAELNVK